MRVRSLLIALLFAGGGLWTDNVLAQDVPSSRDKTSDVVIDDVKLIAQEAALPALRGENPFILRESSWSGEIDPGKARLIQVHLFKRNAYQFWFSVPDRKAGLNLNVYTGKGEIVETKNLRYGSSNVVSLVVSPNETGVYYLRISLQTTIETPQKWAVIYAYR